MSHRLNQRYACASLRELAQQLRYVPADRKAEQVRHLEQLHDEIDFQETYPLDFLVYRITRYRPDRNDAVLLAGDAVQPDLRMMIDELSRSIDMAPGPGETIRTIDQWMDVLHVSRKTIERWRKGGLRWRWFMPPDSDRRRVGLEQSALDHFNATRQQHLERAARFVHITGEQRQQLISQARELKQQQGDLTLHQAAVHLTRVSGRSLETMRLLLEKHDQHPHRLTPDLVEPIFTDRRKRLSSREKRIIARAVRRGVAPSRIAQRFGRSLTSIDRIMKQQRGEIARRIKIHYIKIAIFDHADADEVLLSSSLQQQAGTRKPALGLADLPESLQSLYHLPALGTKAARSMFVRYNYLKFKADQIRRSFNRYEPRLTDLKAFDHCLTDAHQLRRQLVLLHLSAVLSTVKQHLVGQPHTTAQLVELLKIGHTTLFETVELYDPTRNQTFVTQVRNRLQKRLACETPQRSSRAHRRLDGPVALDELINHAKTFDIDLKI